MDQAAIDALNAAIDHAERFYRATKSRTGFEVVLSSTTTVSFVLIDNVWQLLINGRPALSASLREKLEFAAKGQIVRAAWDKARAEATNAALSAAANLMKSLETP